MKQLVGGKLLINALLTACAIKTSGGGKDKFCCFVNFRHRLTHLVCHA